MSKNCWEKVRLGVEEIGYAFWCKHGNHSLVVELSIKPWFSSSASSYTKNPVG